MEIVILLVAILVIAGTTAAFVSARRGPGRGTVLEPPPAPPRTERPAAVTPTPPPAEDLDDISSNEPSSGVAIAPEPEVEPEPELVLEIEEALAEVDVDVDVAVAPVKPRFRDRLGKARGTLAGYLGSVRSREGIDVDTWDELEEALIRADVGVATTTMLLDDLRKEVESKGIKEPEALLQQLKGDVKARLSSLDRTLRFVRGVPNVWLVVGVNGAGKTTTIGKLAKRQITEHGRTVVMAAGDTFRAAAGDQLETWAERSGADIVRGADGGDPSSVIFDAVQRAGSRGYDIVLADTAGRLHTKTNLMEELKKVRRVADREPGKVTEVLLVIDGVTGQNGLAQAREFAQAVDVTGVVLTKLDGSAKGGIVLAITEELGLPVKLVGLGETADDLVDFDPDEFVEALFE
ncbi:MAG: fused signal recognition particle receptor [Actinomycetota bacterium]|nr:fused signal recognition particle receptor [Actinomycetota bacterium]